MVPVRKEGITLGTTTASHMLRHDGYKEAFRQMDRLGRELGEPMDVEAHYFKDNVLYLATKLLPIVPTIATPVILSELRDIVEQYPYARLVAVHGGYNATREEEIYRAEVGEENNGFMEKHVYNSKNGLFPRTMGPQVTSGSTEIAHAFGVPLVTHPNVVQEYDELGILASLQDKVEIHVENERDHNAHSVHLRFFPEQIYDPRAVNKAYVETGKANKLGLDLSHMIDAGVDPLAVIEDKGVQENVGFLHANVADHGRLDKAGVKTLSFFDRFMQLFAGMPVSVRLDLNPKNYTFASGEKMYSDLRNSIVFLRTLRDKYEKKAV